MFSIYSSQFLFYSLPPPPPPSASKCLAPWIWLLSSSFYSNFSKSPLPSPPSLLSSLCVSSRRQNWIIYFLGGPQQHTTLPAFSWYYYSAPSSPHKSSLIALSRRCVPVRRPRPSLCDNLSPFLELSDKRCKTDHEKSPPFKLWQNSTFHTTCKWQKSAELNIFTGGCKPSLPFASRN